MDVDLDAWDREQLAKQAKLDAIRDAVTSKREIENGPVDDVLTTTQQARFLRTLKRIPGFRALLLEMLGRCE